MSEQQDDTTSDSQDQPTTPAPSQRVPARTLSERFTDIADAVSSAMGTPLNIGLWLAAVAVWFLAFIVNPALANSNFLPSWFTSQAFNFPLNSITTLAELYIGFLVAAASNRLERRNHAQMQRLDTMEQQNVRMERDHGAQLSELATIIREQRQELADVKRILAELRAQSTASVQDPKTGRFVSRKTQPLKVS